MKKMLMVLSMLFTTCTLYAQINLNNGLLACYSFTGNSIDLTGNGHDGIVNGPTLCNDRFGNLNSAYQYDGIDDYINIGAFSTFTQSPSFSISVWIQPNQVKPQTILMLIPDDFTDRFNAMAFYSHNGVSSTIWDYGDCTAGGRLMQLGTVFSNVWQHYVYTINPATGMKVYKNGVLDLNQPSSSICVNRQRTLWIGGGFDAANAQFYFDGSIDDMRLYDRELTSAEVSTLFQLEHLCTPTALPEISASDFEIKTVNNNLVVKVRDGLSSSNFKIINTQGKLLYKKEKVRGGEEFEVSLSAFTRGMMIYSFEAGEDVVAGKIYN
ncbi:MAG TPA: LamG domain-containing protein [Bacteroidia bacterium]|nr:LamG domain-containing protein [Bacteroidia bacterium]